MLAKPLPSQAELREFFDYNPETGSFTWRSRYPVGCLSHEKQWETRFASQEAGWHLHDGYRGVTVPGHGRRKFLVHRLIWVWVTGMEPRFVDHEDLDGGNNRWANLRECSKTENQGNCTKRAHNTSGLKNIHWDEGRGRWVIQIKKEGVRFMRRTRTLAGAIALQRLKASEIYREFARSV